MTFSCKTRDNPGMATGMDLRLERTAARVTLKALAEKIGRDYATVHRWEQAAWVDETRTRVYREALASLTENPSVDSAAA